MTQITEALEAARAHILDAYRIWQADDVSAVPPPKSGAGAVIAKIDAVLSSPIAVEWKVKALEWRLNEEGWQIADTFFGGYRIERNPHDHWCWGVYFHGETGIGLNPADNFEAAKAAAQVDFNERICSALDAKQAPDFRDMIIIGDTAYPVHSEVCRAFNELLAAPVPPSSPGKEGGQEVEEQWRDEMSAIASYLGAGMGDDNSTPSDLGKRIRWGIDNHAAEIVQRAADVVERGSKEGATWGALKSRILSLSPQSTALVERLEPIGYIGQSSADMLRSGEISGAALSREATKSSTVPVFSAPPIAEAVVTPAMIEAFVLASSTAPGDNDARVKAGLISALSAASPPHDGEGWGRLRGITFAVQHNPNCPSPWLVRLAGKGPIDLKPYGDGLGLRKHETGDILGFGKTFTEAARSAIAAAKEGSDK